MNLIALIRCRKTFSEPERFKFSQSGNLFSLSSEERAGVRTSFFSPRSANFFITLVALLSLFCGCDHVNPKHGKFVTPGGKTNAAVTLQGETMTNKIDSSWLKPASDLFTLGPGDKLEIELLGEPLSRTTESVGPDGKIYYSLLPGIDVWGLTLSQAKKQIEDGLGKYVRTPPQISLVLRGVESKRIWLLGRVQAPGVYAMSAPITLLEAISMAGGTMSLTSFRDQAAAGINNELADLQRSFIIRQGKLLPIDFHKLLSEGDLSQNIYLQPDDFIYFPAAKANDVYVLGAVTQPRPVPYTDDLTVAGAIANAYGILKDAYPHHVAVVRGSLAQPEIAIVDYKAIIRGDAPDVVLQPHDIVYVPLSPYRYLRRYAQVVVNTFASSAAINAGSSLILKAPIPGTGVFIPLGSGVQIIPPVSPAPPH